MARLHTVIDHLISHSQTFFIRSLNIYDGWVIASEVLDVMKTNKKGLIFILDYEKTYNHVSWHFLSFVLRKMGFSAHWIRWITRCISVAPISVLFNGFPSCKFFMKGGLRQGCPLSILLFNLVAESLSILVNKFQEKS